MLYTESCTKTFASLLSTHEFFGTLDITLHVEISLEQRGVLAINIFLKGCLDQTILVTDRLERKNLLSTLDDIVFFIPTQPSRDGLALSC